jgi:hypothetical protein
VKYKSLLIALVAGILCGPFLSFGAYEDVLKLRETDTERSLRVEQERLADEAARIDWMERKDQAASDDHLFVKPAPDEDPEVFARNTLKAYYCKEIGVESLPEGMLDTFIAEDVGKDVSYNNALESLKKTKRWGSPHFELTPQELEQYKMSTWEWLWSGGVPLFVLVGLFASIAAISIFHKTTGSKIEKSEPKPEEKGESRMSMKDKATQLQKGINVAQKTVVAVIIPIVALLVARWLIDEFVYYRPGRLDKTWWAWALAFIAIGVIEFFWLKTPADVRRDKETL